MSVKVIIQPNPFKVEYEIKEYTAQQYSIKELFDLQDIGLPVENCIVILNDISITDYDIIPFENDTLIIRAFPAGEGRIGTIFKGIGVGLLGGAGAGAGIGAIFGPPGALIGGIIGGVIGAVSGGISAGRLYDSTQAIDPTHTMEGKRNSGEQYAIVPVVYGTTKMSPSYGGNDFTTTTGEGADAEIFLHQLYVLGYQPTILEQLIIKGSVAIERIRSTFMATFSGSTVTAVGKFTDIVVGMRVLIEGVVNYGEYSVVTATSDTITLDKAVVSGTESITFSFLENTGIYSDLFIEFRYDGTMPNNYPHQVTQASLNQSCMYNSPIFYTTPASVKEAFVNIGFMSGLIEITNSNKMEATSVKYTIEYKEVTDTEWIVAETNTAKGKTREAYRREAHIYFPVIGRYDMRITRTSTDNVGTGISDNMTLLNVRTYKLDTDGNNINPVATDVASNLVLMALKIKASEQLSGSITDLQTVVTRWVKEYDSTIVSANEEDKWIVRESHNPASMYIDAVTNPLLNQYPIPFDALHFNFPALVAFYEWCDKGNPDVNPDGSVGVNYSCNGLLSTETTLQEELKNIVGVARAEFAIIDGKYTVIHDIPRSTPVQMFTARNMLADSFSASRSYEDIPESIEVTFIDKEAVYTTNTIQIPPDIEKKTDPITLGYIDNYAQAYAIGKYVYNSRLLQDRGYVFTVSLDALVATRGDRILVQHDASLLGLSTGRVKSTTIVGGLISTLLVDEVCTMELGKNYGIVVRTGTTINRYKIDTYNGETNTLILNESVPEGEILAGDLFSFGIAEAEVVDCLITDITYDENGNGRISAVIYNETMYDLGQIPEWESLLTITNEKTPRVDISTYGDVDATLSQIISVQNNSSNVRIFQTRPVPPYTEGDLWLVGSLIYDCAISKRVSTSFEQIDWRLRGSSAFDLLNTDTFNEPNPQHRWEHIGGSALPYNLLQTTAYEVTSGEATRAELLVDDEVDWESEEYLAAVTVDASGLSEVITSGNMTTAHIVGRYGMSGYMGETYTNLVVSPDNPTTQDVVISAGAVVIQCYRGTITTSYGVASYGNPLVFVSTGETLTLTMDSVKYGMLSETAFVPPYISGTFTANYDTFAITSTRLELTTEISNMPDEGVFYGMLQLYGDADNYINLQLMAGGIYIYIKATGGEYAGTQVLAEGAHVFTIDWATTVTLSIDGTNYYYTETGDSYGYTLFDSYGFGPDSYGYDDATLAFATGLTTINIGKVDTTYYNNIVTEIEV